MKTPAIVVIAYNRIDSLKRLLDSLARAEYPAGVNVPLIISIDHGDNKGVISLADEFVWKHGDKTVIKYEVNLGLKKHVLTCGDLVNDYGSIIVLEDDLYVSKYFYQYACDALFFVEDNDRIAGVSLYNHRLNVHVREPFDAYDDGYDNYYFQFASSWGQAYDKKQWNSFKQWLEVNDGKDLNASNVPLNVSTWSDKSWLKYYIKYVIETDKYFIYPRKSFTTNFGDVGTHADSTDNDLQVPLAGEKVRKYIFSTLENSKAIYDAFFENTYLKDKVLDNESVEIDLFGYKPVSLSRYILSSKSLPYKIIKSYKRALRPIDANIFDGIEGADYFLYDTDKEGSAPVISESEKILYNYRALSVKKIFKVFSYRIFGK